MNSALNGIFQCGRVGALDALQELGFATSQWQASGPCVLRSVHWHPVLSTHQDFTTQSSSSANRLRNDMFFG